MAELSPTKTKRPSAEPDARPSWSMSAGLTDETGASTRDDVERALRAGLADLQQQVISLTDALAQFKLITDSLPVLVSYVDGEHRYRFVNATYEQWFGAIPMVGERMCDVLGPEAYATVKDRVRRALDGETVRYDGQISFRDGQRFVDATYIPHVAADGSVSGFVALIADVTQKKQLERLHSAAASRSDELLKITGAIADAVSTDEVFQAVVDCVAEAVGASSAAMWLVESDGNRARLVHAVGYASTTRESLEYVCLDEAATSPVKDSIRTAAPVWFASKCALLEAYPHLEPLVTRQSYRIACLPLITRGRVLGTLALTNEEERETSAEEKGFLLLVARYGSQAIERLRLLEQERLSRAEANAAARRLGALSHASKVFMDPSLHLETRLRAIVVEIADTLTSTVGITLLQADGLLHHSVIHHPVPEAQHYLNEVVKSSPLRPGDGSLTGQVVSTGESVFIPYLSPEVLRDRTAAEYREFLERFPVYGMMCASLRSVGRVIGMVTACRLTPNDPYTIDDLRLLEELSERAAAAIENSRLYEESQTAQRRAEHLYGFAQAVAAADNLQHVFDAAIIAIEATLDATRSAILTTDAEGFMRFRAWRDLSEEYRAAVDGHSPWPRDAKAPEPVLVPDVRADATWASYLPLFQRESIGALAFIPLTLDGQVLGKFMVYYDSPHDFEFDEVETARAIANHLASVICRFAAIAALEDTIRSNELFAGVLAHDLRNPLGAIMTAAQLVLIRREGEAAHLAESKPLGRILSSGQRMMVMIDQLLDFTRARSGGGIQVEPKLVNMQEVCAQAIEELELPHPTWNVRTLSSGNLRGFWDPDRMLQVISNLVANAGQHGRLGTDVTVTIDGTAKTSITISVHNEGSIPADILPDLFDPFRTARQRSNPTHGLGLGLFIVREIVRAHGGTVDVTSDEAAGTSFTIWLPRR